MDHFLFLGNLGAGEVIVFFVIILPLSIFTYKKIRKFVRSRKK